MTKYYDLQERKPAPDFLIVIRNQELGIDIFAVYNKTHDIVITQDFLLLKNCKCIEWRYATEREHKYSQGTFSPKIYK
jgi:hypothetical protein